MPTLQPSNVPAPLPQLPALPIQTLSLNNSTPLLVSLQGREGPVILTSVAHYHAPLLLALSLCQCVPTLLPSKVSAPLAQLSALPLQLGEPHLKTSAVNPPPQITAFIFQCDALPLQTSAVSGATPTPPPPLSV